MLKIINIILFNLKKPTNFTISILNSKNSVNKRKTEKINKKEIKPKNFFK